MASQPGLSEGGSGSLYSAADIIEKAQNTWSSLPSFLDWLPGICRSLAETILPDSVPYQVQPVSKIVDETLADQAIVLVVAGVMPVIQECAKHGAGLPPVIRRIQDARITSEDGGALVVSPSILGNELFGNERSHILDRVCIAASASASATVSQDLER